VARPLGRLLLLLPEELLGRPRVVEKRQVEVDVVVFWVGDTTVKAWTVAIGNQAVKTREKDFMIVIGAAVV
jgi:hypothetical protein